MTPRYVLSIDAVRRQRWPHTVWKFKGRRHIPAYGEALVWECITPWADGASYIIRPEDWARKVTR
jgi:hypothetical protein